MFTGIIQEIGTVARVERAKDLLRLTIAAPTLAARVQPLESVAVDGVCLTAVAARQGALTFEIIPETQRLTTLGALRSGARVHLEPSLTLADRLGGHLLFGHIDGLGTLVGRRHRGGELALTIRCPQSLRTFLVAKGPVAVDGISLTVGANLTAATFTLHLIPETLRRTTLGERRLGERVNLEVDYLAKLVRQFVRRR